MRRELVCIEPSRVPQLTVRTADIPHPVAGEVLVRVLATAVNPIDVKRASGYGKRMLSLKGAARFPLVLGNDVAGIVETVGAGANGFAEGQRVFGVLATARTGGAHASHVVVPQRQLRHAPMHVGPAKLAVLPYSFTTMWRAVRATGVNAQNARGTRVLINGASGGLGQLAVQLLHHWGATITAICSRSDRPSILALGAQDVVERGPGRIDLLPQHFDAVLNFASWEDEPALASRLGRYAFGHATTVHPLLANVDRLGWMRGAWASYRQRREVRRSIASRTTNARYDWTLFAPDGEALDALADGVQEGRYALPIGIAEQFGGARAVFAHVSARQRGRAVLVP